MSKLLIAGAGGHGKVVAETAQAMAIWDSIAFLDDRYQELNKVLTWPVIGTLNDAQEWHREYESIIVGIGDPSLRLQLLERYADLGFDIPVLVQPNAWVSPTTKLGMGTVVFAQAAINAATQIGRGCIINTGATVDHDCTISEGTHICPGVHLGGEVSIDRLSWVGIGANIVQQVRIGEGVTIGAGSAVLSDVEDGLTVAGIPAKVI